MGESENYILEPEFSGLVAAIELEQKCFFTNYFGRGAIRLVGGVKTE